MIELSYKLALRCKPFAQELERNKNLFKQIEQITSQNPSFPITHSSKLKLFKDGVINWQQLDNKNYFVNQTRVDQIEKYSKRRFEALIKAIQNSQGGDDAAQ